MSTIYLIRHCETTGQAPEAPLTPRGEEQAQRLCTQLFELRSHILFRVRIAERSTRFNHLRLL